MSRHSNAPRCKTVVFTGSELAYQYATDDPTDAVARARAALERKIAEAKAQLDNLPNWTVMCFPPSACTHDGNCPKPVPASPASKE